ncbi:hypothetical protein HY969_00955 [Candidatus Kaiserbacteria bacterium]|nr:hypothetical protein [Candidatus Kaiserbacteria bacterium]
MPEFDRPFRSRTAEEQLAIRVAKGVELVRDPSKKSVELWLKDTNLRKKALGILVKDPGISMKKFIRELGKPLDVYSIERLTGKRFRDGGSEILKGILEQLEK